MTTTSVGLFLINDVLPTSHKLTGAVTNKGLHDHVLDLAKSDPQLYVRTVQNLKQRGDEIATLEGVSVGLDDIEPDYKARDAILKPAMDKLDKGVSAAEREKIVIEAQGKMLDYSKTHKSSMAQMATSGARGNPAQLMKIIGSPLVSVHPKKGIDPNIIRHSYAEGLKPSEYWVTLPEVRANEVQARISVSEPGEMAKVLVNNMIKMTVANPDCGTKAGVRMRIDDAHIIDRFTQETNGLPRNTLVTPRLIQELKSRGAADLLVRSPMTCSAQNGVCQHCQGLNEKGQLHRIGVPVGVRAAQSMAEPLTQLTLSSRHATLTVKGTQQEPVGVKGIRQYLEVPQSFKFEAVLAPRSGIVAKIETAPQGGHYIHVDNQKLYAAPGMEIRAKAGQHVEAGDALTSGVPNPVKVVNAKGIGEGRQYFVNALHKTYANEGVNLDKRHFELLAKSQMNHVRFLDADPDHPEFLKGDTVNYNAFRDAYTKDVDRHPIDECVGKKLGQEIFHYSVGTTVTPSMIRELKQRGVKELLTNKRLPEVEFVMKPFTMNPLLEPDWIARLSHRYLKGSIQQAAQFGEESDIHGAHPVPAYAHGAEMRRGPQGTF